MNEWLMIAAMATGFLFPVGGTGFLWARRFLMPPIWAILAFLDHIIWYRDISIICMMGFLTLPYGEKEPYWVKFLVFCSYSLCTIGLGFTPWQIVFPFIATGIFALSNWKPTANMFKWKICETIFGILLGIIIASLF